MPSLERPAPQHNEPDRVTTGKGVTLKPVSLPELIGLLQRAHAAAVETGWCDGESA